MHQHEERRRDFIHAQHVADSEGLSRHKVYASLSPDSLNTAEHWPEPKQVEDFVYVSEKIIDEQQTDILTRYSMAIAEQVKFPVSTVFLHGLGVLASAMTKDFYVECEGDLMPVNLYVVTAQPPSTGKSGVNKLFFTAVNDAFKRLNESTRSKRVLYNMQKEKAEAELAKASDEYEAEEATDKLSALEKKLAEVPQYRYALDDTTIEAAEMVAGRQNGMFNIISAEAESINVIVGSVYGESTKKQNFNLLLKAWDGEEMSSVRVGRDGYNGVVKASVAVIAQYDSVDTILAAGARGRGLAERFLLLSEPSRLGERTFGKKRTRIDQQLAQAYAQLAQNIVNQGKTVLTINELSWLMIEKEREKYEQRMSAEGDFVGNMLIGFAGKANKQILKIASVLHACNAWSDGGDKSTEINYKCVARAITIFNKLCDAYANAADQLGHAGKNTEINALIEYIEMKVNKKVYKMRVSELRRNIKGKIPFNNINNFSKHLKESLLPHLEELNYCAVSDSGIVYFNRRL